MLNFNQFKNINEGLSDILYHFTYIGNLKSIITQNKLHGATNIGSKSDYNVNKGKYFYISTQRSKGKSGYAEKTGGNTCLVLDGRKLGYKYKGGPIDYWQWSTKKSDYDSPSAYKQALLSKELEDRIFLDEPNINNVDKYILEIHILVENLNFLQKKDIEQIIEYSEKYNIPVFFYDNKDNYQLQNKKKALPFEKVLSLEFTGKEHEDLRKNTVNYAATSIFKLVLFDNEKQDELIKEIKDVIKDNIDVTNDKIDSYIDNLLKDIEDYKYMMHNDFRVNDKFRSIEADIHNNKAKSNPILDFAYKLLISEYKKYNCTELFNYMKKKFKINDKLNN